MEPWDREKFILDNQEAFRFGAMEEFGVRDAHFEEDGEIISRKTIEDSMNASGAETYRIVADGEKVGGVILKIDCETKRNELVLLFVNPSAHSCGVGYGAWQEIEKLHPETLVWETCTPYFEKRNLHFYINKCGFHAVEFLCAHHPDTHGTCDTDENDADEELMFRFEKRMQPKSGNGLMHIL